MAGVANVRVVASQVSHRYRSGAGLSEITLSVESGERVAVMGPSGSGKSTLLAILGLVLKPTEGVCRVQMGGQACADVSSSAQTKATLFAWVFQTVNVIGWRSAVDNTALGALASGSDRTTAYSRARSALEDVGLGARLHERVSNLSGGELQRVCIARAAAAAPRFVLADEPTGQLDAESTELAMRSLWGALSDESALIVATHDAGVAAWCDRIVRL